MNLLGIDTATAGCAVCLLRADGEAFERTPPVARLFEQPAHTRELLPAVAGVLDAAGVGWRELGGVAVGVGPGAFTGLRIGVATARAIAAAAGVRLTPVSSLAAHATAAGDGRRPVAAVLDARRGEYYYGAYRGTLAGSARCVVTDAVAPPEAAVAALAGHSDAAAAPLAVGDGALALAAQLAAVGLEVPPGDDHRHVLRALAICRLAAAGAALPPATVAPNYIRPPDVQPPLPAAAGGTAA